MGQLASFGYSNTIEEVLSLANENPMNSIQVSAIVTQSENTLKDRIRLDNGNAQKVVTDDETPKEKDEI
ncbi:hypothetical protein H5410_050595 [Solanum commersonii]|uniref:Uncharacterized protein n=1 Tax=Solanum commersonii TaxID=4109 RepID=A0A9J5WYC8_SOLCO|nr:hypothetical protein H5410_050595 [Solanum commersonii]